MEYLSNIGKRKIKLRPSRIKEIYISDDELNEGYKNVKGECSGTRLSQT